MSAPFDVDPESLDDLAFCTEDELNHRRAEAEDHLLLVLAEAIYHLSPPGTRGEIRDAANRIFAIEKRRDQIRSVGEES